MLKCLTSFGQRAEPAFAPDSCGVVMIRDRSEEPHGSILCVPAGLDAPLHTPAQRRIRFHYAHLSFGCQSLPVRNGSSCYTAHVHAPVSHLSLCFLLLAHPVD